MSITRFGVSSSLSPRDCARVSAVEDFALTRAERALFEALTAQLPALEATLLARLEPPTT